MGKNKKKQQNQKQQSSSSSNNKKLKKVFKVATSASKKSQKQAKEIPKRLKQLDLKKKDNADTQLKDLHLKMVSKKEKKAAKAVGKKKGAVPNTEQVQDSLDKMDVK